MAPMDPAEDLIRKNLALFREQSGLSRAQLSDLSGVPEKNLVRYESGDTSVPAAALGTLAKAFGRDAGDFYKEEPPPAPPKDELPVVFFRIRPGSPPPPENLMREVREAVERVNQAMKKKPKR